MDMFGMMGGMMENMVSISRDIPGIPSPVFPNPDQTCF
jgi:hypothetical protein